MTTRAEERARRAAAHDARVSRIYRIPRGAYAALYTAQGGRCALCRRATGRSKRLAVDHDHATGEVRGLLCSVCNRMLGHMRDDLAFAARIHAYLLNPPARLVLAGLADEVAA